MSMRSLSRVERSNGVRFGFPVHDTHEMSVRTAQLAVLLLCLCCVFWGFSFPAMQISAAAVDKVIDHHNSAPHSLVALLGVRATFNGWRFGAAVLICALLGLRSGRLRREELIGGAIIGLCFGGGMLLQLCGLLYTLPSISSFLTALAVVFAPIAQSLVFRRPVGGRVWTAVGIAVVGMVVLSSGSARAAAPGTLALSPPLPHLTTVMLLSAAAVNAAIGIACGGGAMYRSATLLQLSHNFTFGWSFAGLVVISSVLALQLMNAWQPRISPASAAVVYCLEPVFGTLFSLAFGTEAITVLTIAGGVIILLAVLAIVRRPAEEPDADFLPLVLAGALPCVPLADAAPSLTLPRSTGGGNEVATESLSNAPNVFR
jgi:drug/metabolite transporter (DMT)-like permease